MPNIRNEVAGTSIINAQREKQDSSGILKHFSLALKALIYQWTNDHILVVFVLFCLEEELKKKY